jgi:cell wall-associated NlpC family hydrolase
MKLIGFLQAQNCSNYPASWRHPLAQRISQIHVIEEARHMGDAARWQREPDIDRLDRAIDAVERQPQCARAHVVAGKNVHEGVHQAAGQCHDGVLREDRLEQIAQAVIDRRRHDGDERLVEAAECLVDTPEKLGGKTRGKGRARLVEERTDGFEAEPAQCRAGFRRTRSL